MSIKPVPLIFKEVSEQKTHLQKVKHLKENRNDMVDLLLELAFSKDIRITLPEGAPQYQKTGEVELYNATLLYANRRAYYANRREHHARGPIWAPWGPIIKNIKN